LRLPTAVALWLYIYRGAGRWGSVAVDLSEATAATGGPDWLSVWCVVASLAFAGSLALMGIADPAIAAAVAANASASPAPN